MGDLRDERREQQRRSLVSPPGSRPPAQARVHDMWDVVKWQHHTLSVAWWALVAFAILVIIAAGSRTTKK